MVKKVVFIENYQGVLPIIKKNLLSLSSIKNYEIIEKNIFNENIFLKLDDKFDIVFWKTNSEILNTPIHQYVPLKCVDSKLYKYRLKAAKKKTGHDSVIMIIKAKIKNI